ncbi:MAG: type IV pilus modification PilV family protein, partial [Planctomycetota bacterium]
MSLMIMSIGVVSLATLFPISVKRVLDATNLTNATVARFNAESFVDSYPSIIHEPDGNYSTREGGRNYIVDPLGFWDRYQQLDLFDDGTVNGSVNASTEDLLIHFEYNRPSAINRPIDTGPAQTRFLGDNPTAPNLFSSIDVARAITTLPDTATDFGEGFPDPNGTNTAAYTLNGNNRIIGLVLPKEINLSPLALASTDANSQSPDIYQAVIFDKDGDHSEVRQLATV